MGNHIANTGVIQAIWGRRDSTDRNESSCYDTQPIEEREGLLDSESSGDELRVPPRSVQSLAVLQESTSRVTQCAEMQQSIPLSYSSETHTLYQQPGLNYLDANGSYDLASGPGCGSFSRFSDVQNHIPYSPGPPALSSITSPVATLKQISPSPSSSTIDGFPGALSYSRRPEYLGETFFPAASSRSVMSRPPTSPMHRQRHHSSQHGFSSPMEIDSSSGPSLRDSSELLPWDKTQIISQMSDSQRRGVKPEIQAKIDKGFFRAESDWTCYRRNYFAVHCSYSLKLEGTSIGDVSTPCFLLSGDKGQPIDRFSISISACINEDEAKTVELVQHTPKRDKGPVNVPFPIILKPNQSAQLGNYASLSASGMYPPTSPYFQGAEPGHFAPPAASSPPPLPADEQTTTIFERIQFKRATANNGKRRAQQQYFHVRVELSAGFLKPGANRSSLDYKDYEWTKVASRLSAQMVVRGRSPGHYTDAQQQNSTNMGGGAGMSGGSGPGYNNGGMNMYGPQMGNHSAHYGFGSRYVSTGQCSQRSMVQRHAVDSITPLSPCNNLDDSGLPSGHVVTGHSGPFADHSTFSGYNITATQSMGLLSPAFSAPSPTSLAGTPRPQQLLSPPHVKNEMPRPHENKGGQPFVPRSDPSCAPVPMPHYEAEIDGVHWMGSNTLTFRDCQSRWPHISPDHRRVKRESMSPV